MPVFSQHSTIGFIGAGAVGGTLAVDAGVPRLPGTTFGIEADGAMQQVVVTMALALGGRPILLTAADKALYHLSAVMMDNLLTGLAATAAQRWEHLGASRADGLQAVVAMMRSVVHTLERTGIPAAVAGPYVCGDIGTIRRHFETLSATAPAVLPLYRELALAALPFGVEKGALAHD